MCQERLVIKINVMAKKEDHAAGCPKLLKERERRSEGGREAESETAKDVMREGERKRGRRGRVWQLKSD